MSFRNVFKRDHAPKKSVISKTAEREFENKVKKLEQLEENTKRIYKDMKRGTESQTGQMQCEAKMTRNLMMSQLCKEEDRLRHTVEQWNNISQRLEALLLELNSNSQKTVMEPMKKLGCVFPSVNTSIKKREQSLQEYNKCQLKVDKYQDRERTGANIVKLDTSKKALGAAKRDFDIHDQALMEDMPKLYEGRVEYFQPSLQAHIRSQIKYYTDAQKSYSTLSKQMRDNIAEVGGDDDDDSLSDADQRIQQKLAEIRGLSITIDG